MSAGTSADTSTIGTGSVGGSLASTGSDGTPLLAGAAVALGGVLVS